MSPTSKRYRRIQRRIYRRLRRVHTSLVTKPFEVNPAKSPVSFDICSRVRNNAAKWLNARLRDYPAFEGYPLIDGWIECPECHKASITTADPKEWMRNPDGTWAVTDYWGGIAQCCGLILAFQPDGHAEAYVL